MPTEPVTATARLPRRARHLIPLTTPRRGELLAACGVAILLAHLLFAQMTIAFAVVFHAVTKVSRWRPLWLAAPAAVGVIWVAAIGPHTAVAGLLAGPTQVASYLAGIGRHPDRLRHLGAAFTGMVRWLPRQVPLALVTGAAEAAVAAWLDWLHTDEWELADPRPGLAAATRRVLAAWTVRSGGILTRDGACLGVATSTGARVALSWGEMTGGVLVAGDPDTTAEATGFRLVHAAVRRRKPVIVIDIDGGDDPAGPLAAVCAAVDAPLLRFGPRGPACYEPLRYGDPARRAALVTALVDWAGTADQHRRGCTAYLRDVFAVIDAAPSDPRVPVLDDVTQLLDPTALRARLDRVPGYHPRRAVLAERVRVSADLAEADPLVVTVAARQLTEAAASPFGPWLRPTDGAQAPVLDVGNVVRHRAVAVFSLHAAVPVPHDGTIDVAARLARLVVQDILATAAELRAVGVDADGLVWLRPAATLPAMLLSELIAQAGSAGLGTVLTGAALPDDRVAEQVNALVIHRVSDPRAADRLARLTGKRPAPPATTPPVSAHPSPDTTVPAAPPPRRAATGHPTAPPSLQPAATVPKVAPATIRGLARDQFLLAVQQPARLVPHAVAVPAPTPPPPTVGSPPAGTPPLHPQRPEQAHQPSSPGENR